MDELHRLRAAPPIARVLGDIVLRPAATPLLRLCLYEGPAWQTAWRAWRAAVGDPREAFSGRAEGLKGLLPLLFTAARHGGVPVDRGFLTHLRTAYLRESIRFRSYTRVCRQVLTVLSEASVTSVVLRGSALAETVYPQAEARHSHGLSLWLADRRERSRAMEALLGAGLGLAGGLDESMSCLTLTHSSLMPVFLQTELFPGAQFTPPEGEIWERSSARTIAGAPARVLSPADALLEVCGRACVSPYRTTLRWACDGWLLIRHAAALDWDVLLQDATRTGLGVPLLVTLAYLSESLDAAVPTDVLERLTRAAGAEPGGGELALRSLQQAERLSLAGLVLRPHRCRHRVTVARHLLFPAPEYMRLRLDLRADAPVVPHYLHRLGEFLFGPLRRRLRTGVRRARRVCAAARAMCGRARVGSQ